MDQSLKQRLVGAIVLISLAVIFLPLVFDGQQQRVNSKDYEYPEQPAMTIEAVDFSPIEEEAREVIAAVEAVSEAKAQQAAQSSEAEVQQDAVAAAQASSSQATVEDYIEQEKAADQAIRAAPQDPLELADAWIIQVGAFSSKANADGLRDKLIAADYKAYSKKVGALYKVYVGPEIRKYRLDQQKIALERDYQVKTLILKYIP
ncbi:SPOR domain-containing protein [Ketobacter alkanivorans]|uniref:SPOR domain-containing protein n=1 Tax=Ketobacter alkanivorans TaxID=1917421 RepID=A0A2K9LGB2_9GAMM|nr:SPOR domain-containing protein [Ketobacter alkanivorans]AUM11201.1 hypothetical protein Kalk_01595 [Ketobacter alkanivorans]